MRALIVGNWKMNGLAAQLAEAKAIAAWLEAHPIAARVGLCPPATLISRMAQALAGGPIAIGGQDCSAEAPGAHTGDVSAAMLRDAGASLVIVGHSERRAAYGEKNADVAAKARAASAAGLEPIICVGESLQERRIGRATAVVAAQVRASVPLALKGAAFALAYEPVWAIGSGMTPQVAEIEAVHRAIRSALKERLGEPGEAVPILYGGSVKADNAAGIFTAAEVGGALVGGASLTAEAFTGILAAA